IVANGIVDLPFDFKLSSIVTYGSGAPYFVIDANREPPPQGFRPGTIALGYFNNLPHFLQVDMRLQKRFMLFGDKEFTLSADVFNLFNRANFGGVRDSFICCGGNPNFGVPNSLSGPPRTFQFGAAFKF
ncbi:MAG: TonB-dependent receptor, partial [Sphingomonas bacterium]|nr:TonB-dependent receptor [Sphingomonas bacterium]